MDNPQKLSFEETLAQLEDAVTRLETGGMALDEAMALFERGQELAALCEEALNNAQLRLESLSKGAEGYEIAAPDDEE